MKNDSQDCLDENTIVEILEGIASKETRETALRHIDQCPDCRKLLTTIVRKQSKSTHTSIDEAPSDHQQTEKSSEINPGDMIGRYIVLDVAGRGGMGVVYSAYDKELDRKVALKFLASTNTDEDYKKRLRREARNLARFSHPNVVTVYDVGTYKDRNFIALEYVEGQNIRQWANNERPKQDEILDAYIKAGKGIIAAHKAGIIHRDIKPDNILVDPKHRVCVTDFGLSMLGDKATSADSGRPSSIAGTPVYMAPELFQKQSPTEASDQYSFAISLSETLLGKNGQKRENKAPRRILRVLKRATQENPDDRFSSMEALIAQLSRKSTIKSSLMALGLVSFFGLFFALWALGYFQTSPAEQCSAGASEIRSIWNSQRKAKIRSEFLKTQLPYADEAVQRISRKFDAFSQDWSESYENACRDTHVHHKQTDKLLDLRLFCHDQQRINFESYVDAFESGGDDVVRSSLKSLRSFPSVRNCSKGLVVHHWLKLPPPLQRAEHESVLKLIGQASALCALSRYKEALPKAQQAREAAGKLNPAYPSTEAESAFVQSNAYVGLGNYKSAEEVSHEALLEAEKSGDHQLLTRAWLNLGILVGVLLKRPHEAGRMVDLAQTHVGHLQNNKRELQARIFFVRANLFKQKGQYAESLEYYQSSLDLFTQVEEPDSLLLSQIHVNTSIPYGNLGRLSKARFHLDEALKIQTMHRDIQTSWDPGLATVLNHLGDIMNRQGDRQGALKVLERSLEIREKVYGKTHRMIADNLTELGILHMNLKNHKMALELLDRSSDILEETSDESGVSLTHKASIFLAQGQIYSQMDKCNQAVLYYEKALPLRIKAMGEGHHHIGYDRLAMARCSIALEKPDEALGYLEPVIESWNENNSGQEEMGVLRYVYAKALWDHGKNPNKALKFARMAQINLKKIGSSSLDELETFIAEMESTKQTN